MSSSSQSDEQSPVELLRGTNPAPSTDKGHPMDGESSSSVITPLDSPQMNPTPGVLGSDAEVSRAARNTSRAPQRAKVRTFSATDRDNAMLETIAEYHGLTKSGTITSLIRREFWRIFPSGTEQIRPDQGARIDD